VAGEALAVQGGLTPCAFSVAGRVQGGLTPPPCAFSVAGRKEGVRPPSPSPIPRLREHGEAVGDEPVRGREADPLAPADAGDQRGAVAQSPSSRPYSER
jgi:hypothetical protein